LEVARGILSAGGVAPTRRAVHTNAEEFGYDQLIIATGATHAYFGHEEWARYAPGSKRIEDAVEIRRRVLMTFERAEMASDPAHRQGLTTFVVIGGGLTGVDLVGAIADMAREALPRDFRNVDAASPRVLLIEAGSRLLAAFPEKLSAYAQRVLERRGVEVLTGSPATDIKANEISMAKRASPPEPLFGRRAWLPPLPQTGWSQPRPGGPHEGRTRPQRSRSPPTSS
jgi:NADH dehydrogenase